jgi:hypothetical protein
MRKTLMFVSCVAFLGTLAFAESFNGKLIDATCMNTQKNMTACVATSATTTFLLSVDGKTYQLDQNGNTKATEALKNRADRTTPNAPATTEVNAKVSGTKEGDIIKVESIDVQ